MAHEFGDAKTAAKLVDRTTSSSASTCPPKCAGPYLAEQTTGLGEKLTDAVRAIARENPRLSGVIDVIDFNATARVNGPSMMGGSRSWWMSSEPRLPPRPRRCRA